MEHRTNHTQAVLKLLNVKQSIESAYLTVDTKRQNLILEESIVSVEMSIHKYLRARRGHRDLFDCTI